MPLSPEQVDDIVSRGYAQGVGLADAGTGDPAGELVAAVAAGDVERSALVALRRRYVVVEQRDVASLVRRQFLDRVLGLIPE